MKKSILVALALIAVMPTVNAQEIETLKLTPTGRVLMDAAGFVSNNKEEFHDGATIGDVRLGLKGTYGKWSGKIDVSFSQNKVGLKDLNIQYNFDKENLLRMGNFIHQYGLQSSTSSSMKPTFEEPLSNSVFNAARQLGVMYVHSGPKYLGTLSAHFEPSAVTLTPDDLNGEGFGFITRQLWRPIIKSDGTFFQVGVSAAITSAQSNGAENPHDSFRFAANFPTRVDKVLAVGMTLTDAKNMVKFTPELMAAYGKFAVEAQYFYNHVNFKQGLHGWTGQGGYVDVRTLILGDKFGYSAGDGGIATPKPGSLELAVMYNYLTLSDAKAEYINAEGGVGKGIYGGRLNEFGATFTYYINPYFLARVNYTYTHRWSSQGVAARFTQPTDMSVIQARLQFIF